MFQLSTSTFRLVAVWNTHRSYVHCPPTEPSDSSLSETRTGPMFIVHPLNLQTRRCLKHAQVLCSLSTHWTFRLVAVWNTHRSYVHCPPTEHSLAQDAQVVMPPNTQSVWGSSAVAGPNMWNSSPKCDQLAHCQLSGNNSKRIYFACISCLRDTGLYLTALTGFKLFYLKLYFTP